VNHDQVLHTVLRGHHERVGTFPCPLVQQHPRVFAGRRSFSSFAVDPQPTVARGGYVERLIRRARERDPFESSRCGLHLEPRSDMVQGDVLGVGNQG
jgi:hypothetical protein